MPVFGFECATCGRRFDELVRRVEEVAEVRCPTCGSAEIQREVSAPAIGGTSGGDGGYTPPSRGNCSPFS